MVVRTSTERGFTLVELLVVIALVGVIGTAITNVILSTMRTQQFNDDMRTVMDDGRISLDRIRNELRPARRVLADGSSDSTLRIWVDQNQDGQMQASELICFATSEIDPGTERYELLRWTGAAEDCDVPGDDARVIARTLVRPDAVFAYDPQPVDDPLAPRTRKVTVTLLLEVRSERGPDAIEVETTLRIRNVD